MPSRWSARAEAAEDAVLSRHLRRLWCLPNTELGVVAWPPTSSERVFGSWNYWWQAHLIDCAVDAADRNPDARRDRRIDAIARAVRIRNVTGWTNRYFDDMAWMGLALERAARDRRIVRSDAVDALEQQLARAWNPAAGGGIPWRKRDDFYNAPANGPAAILLARLGLVGRATAMADWIHGTLRDPQTGLILDGIRGGVLERVVYTYNQGVTLGVETELAVRAGDPRHRRRVCDLVNAVSARLCRDDIVVGGSGGDGGLFNGILARYLALVVTDLPVVEERDADARSLARRLVLASAEAAWEHRVQVEGLPLFGHDWTVPARLPGLGGPAVSGERSERDLSVQLSAWMLLEAAHRVESAD